MVTVNSVVNIFSSLIFERLNLALGTDKLILISSLIGMCGLFGGVVSLAIAGAFQIVSGAVYYIYLKKASK